MTNENRVRELAQAAARRGEEFVAAVRTSNLAAIQTMLAPNSAAAYLLEMFGLALFRLDLRLDEPEEKNRLTPYDLQIEGQVALLELGVLEPLEVEGAEQHGHLRRLFGSSLLLSFDQDWRITEVLPFNSEGELNPQNPTDQKIIETHQGKIPLPLQYSTIDNTEGLFLDRMQDQAGRFNLEELLNALRLWRDFKAKTVTMRRLPGNSKAWAGAVEYLISLFDYHEAESKILAKRYGTDSEAILQRARELTQTLNVTQFDDRYSIHPDPIAHYRTLFGELGVNPERDERVRLAREQEKVFDTIEVPPDDDDFFGPN